MATTTIDAAGSDPIEILESNGSGTEKMRITNAGNVGIGTTNPGYLLDLQQSTGTYSPTALSTPSLRVFNTANGATGNQSSIMFEDRTADASAGVFSIISFAHSGSYLQNLAFQAQTGASTYAERMRIDQSGNVGIGTTSPGKLLDVNGDINVSGFASFTLPAARVSRNATQTISAGLSTAIAFNTHDFDNDSMHSDSTNNTRVTVPSAGIYLITGTVEWLLGSSLNNEIGLKIYKNGTISGLPVAYVSRSLTSADNNGAPAMGCTTIVSLAANDYLELYAYNGTSFDQTIQSISSYSPRLMVVKLSN